MRPKSAGFDCKLCPLTFGSCGLSLCSLARFLHGVLDLMLAMDGWRSRFDNEGRFSGSGVGNLIGDLLPFVRLGFRSLGVGAVGVESGVVSDDINGVLEVYFDHTNFLRKYLAVVEQCESVGVESVGRLFDELCP